jgi:hypothetical protein
VRWIVASWLLFHALSAPDSSNDSASAERAWKEASALARKLDEIKKNHAAGASESQLSKITLSQSEINSYLKLMPPKSVPAAIYDVRLRLTSGRIHLSARVDFDRIQSALLQASTFRPAAFLSGQMPVEISSQFDSANGFGSVVLDEVRLGPTLVSPEMVGRFVRSITRSSRNPDGFDILAPFRLPYSIRKIRLKSGRADLVF